VRWKEELDRREQLRGRDHDGLEAEVRDLANEYRTRAWGWRGNPRIDAFGRYATRAEAIALRDDKGRRIVGRPHARVPRNSARVRLPARLAGGVPPPPGRRVQESPT
jgi:hypothetical protein